MWRCLAQARECECDRSELLPSLSRLPVQRRTASIAYAHRPGTLGRHSPSCVSSSIFPQLTALLAHPAHHLDNLTKDAALPASTKLPLELTDKIIDCLLADDAALRACSLVCRAFLRRSRYHRFRYVNLNQRTSEKFENLLNTSPDIGAYVRELHVSTSTFERPPTWVDERLPRIASRLSAVASLHLKGNGEYRAAPFYHLSSVRELHMTHCEVYTMNEFASIIGSFQDLEVVCCRDVLVGRSQTLDANPAKLKRAPRVLEFSSCRLDGPMLVDWLLINGLHNPLSITLVPLQRAAIEAVGRFMRIAAPTLRSLKLAMVVIKSDTTFSGMQQWCSKSCLLMTPSRVSRVPARMFRGLDHDQSGVSRIRVSRSLRFTIRRR